MKDNVKIMTDVFKHAMIFEKYFKLWSDALRYVDNLLEENKDKIERALNGIEREELTIRNIDNEYNKYKLDAERDIQKRKKICFSIVGIIVTIVVTTILLSLLLNFLNLRKLAALVLAIIPLVLGGFVPLIIVIILGYNLYQLYKRKKDLETYTPENSEKQKKVSTNNIKAFRAVLEKTKKEEIHLSEKKQLILTEQRKAKETLKQIYSYDLIPKRYQGLVQMATIYGYLHNGICTCIRGHGGVYERYEDDLKAGIIIEYLDCISKKLDTVIKNQREVINVLDSIDYTLSQIKREVELGNEIMSDVRTNTAIGAAAAQQSAAYQAYIASVVWSNQ